MRISSLAAVFVFAFTAGVLHGCGSSSPAKSTPKCLLNSDCHTAGATLVCALGYCVSPCNESGDCAPGQLCIKSDNGNACRAPEIAKGCVMNSDCTNLCSSAVDGGGAAAVCPIVCGRDRSCRSQCVTDVDCPGGNLPDGSKGKQKCTASGACIDPVVDVMIYDPVTNDFKSNVSGAAGTSGAAGGTAGTTGAAGDTTGTAGTTGAAGKGTDGGAGTGAAGTGTDAAAGTTGAAGTGTDGGSNPDTAEAVDMTTVTPNKAVHQGQSGVTITITKAAGGLSNPVIVSLGALDKSKAAVQTSSTDTSLVIRVTVPHGAPLGKQTLVVSTKGGLITATDVIEITAITASPTGSDANAGSAPSPFRSFGQALLVADVGDTIHLMDGIYSSATMAMGGSDEKWNTPIPNNVTIVGDSVAGTILDGAGASGADGIDSPAMLNVQNLTVQHFPRYGVYVNVANTSLTMQHVVVKASASYGLYVDTAALGSTITFSGSDSLIDQQAYYGIYINGNQSNTNAKITLNITDATVQAQYTPVSFYYTSGTTLNMTNGTLKDLGSSGAITVSQTNNVIGNTITLKNTTVIGGISLNDKTATLTMMGGSVTEKSGSVFTLSAAASVNFTGTTFTMTDTSNAIAVNGANTSMTMTNCKIIGGGAGIAQQGAGSAVKLRGTEILSSNYYAYYMSNGTLDLGTAADSGMNGLGLPISTSYPTLYVASTGCTITSSSTTFGDHLDAQNNVIQGVAPTASAGAIMGPVTRAPQIYYIAAGSQITFF